MMRTKLPNGVVTSEQFRYLGAIIAKRAIPPALSAAKLSSSVPRSTFHVVPTFRARPRHQPGCCAGAVRLPLDGAC